MRCNEAFSIPRCGWLNTIAENEPRPVVPDSLIALTPCITSAPCCRNLSLAGRASGYFSKSDASSSNVVATRFIRAKVSSDLATETEVGTQVAAAVFTAMVLLCNTASEATEEDEMEVEDAEADSSKPSGRLDGAGAVMLLRAFLITRCNPSEKVRLPSPTVSTLPNSGIPGSGAPLILAHVAELMARYSIQHTQAKGGSSSRYGSAQSRTMPPARLISILVAISTI